MHQLELLGYCTSIHPSLFVVQELEFSLDRMAIWKDNTVEIFYLNFEKYNRQRTDFPKYFNEEFMSYRSYRETLIAKKVKFIIFLLSSVHWKNPNSYNRHLNLEA